MSVLAWDGKTLAADKRSVMCSRATTVTKIFRAANENALIGISGDLVRGLELMQWFNAGAVTKDLPEFQKSADDYVPLLVIRPAGIFMFENAAVPFKVEEPRFATGSGRDYALAAMHLGKSARDAVALACELSTGCGNGIDTLELA